MVTVSPDVIISQLILSCQLTVKVVEPVFMIVTPVTMLGPFTVPEYAIEAGEIVKPAVGPAGLTVRVTGTVLVTAPGAETAMAVLYVPLASPARFTFAVTVPLLVPDEGLRISQPALSLTVQDNVPVPELEIVNAFAAGLAPPTVAEKLRLKGFTLKLGMELGGRTVNDIGRIVLRVPPLGPTSTMMTFDE